MQEMMDVRSTKEDDRVKNRRLTDAKIIGMNTKDDKHRRMDDHHRWMKYRHERFQKMFKSDENSTFRIF